MSSGRNRSLPLIDPDDDDDNLDTDDSGTNDAETARAKEASTSLRSGLVVDDYSDFESFYEDLESELSLMDDAVKDFGKPHAEDFAVGRFEHETDEEIAFGRFEQESGDGCFKEISIFLGRGERNNGNMDGVRPNDILCGRGEHVNRHPGNKLFHGVKDRLQRRYLRATRRKEKTAIAQELVDTMKRGYGSRFLAYCPETGKFVEVDDEKRVLEKAKQALREVFTAEQRSLKRQRFSAALRLKKQLLNAGLGKSK